MNPQPSSSETAALLTLLRLPSPFTRDNDEKELFLLRSAMNANDALESGMQAYCEYLRNFFAGWQNRFPSPLGGRTDPAEVRRIQNRDNKIAFDELALRVDLLRGLRGSRICLPPGFLTDPGHAAAGRGVGAAPQPSTQAPPLPVLFLPPTIAPPTHPPLPSSSFPAHRSFIEYNSAEGAFVAGPSNATNSTAAGPSNHGCPIAANRDLGDAIAQLLEVIQQEHGYAPCSACNWMPWLARYLTRRD